MKWYACLIAAGTIVCATAAHSAAPTCAERFAAAGIPDTSVHGGDALRMEGRQIIVQNGELPDSVCRRLDKLKAADNAEHASFVNLVAERDSAQKQLAAMNDGSALNFLFNHVIELVFLLGIVLGAFFIGWPGFFIGVGFGMRRR